MKKFQKVLVFMFVLVASIAAVSASGSSENGTVLADVKERGRLIVGTEAQYAPYEFKDMNAGQVDIGLAAFTNTPERAEVIDFSSIYEESLQYLVVAAGNEDVYTTPESLAGLKVGAQRGTIQSQLIMKTMPDSELFELAKYPELSIEVQNGNIAGLVVDAAVGDSIIASSDGKLVKANYTFDSKEATFGKSAVIQKGNPDFLAEVNKVIERVVADGSYIQAYNDAVALQKELGL